MHTIKYHRNDLLNIYIMHNVQNADNRMQKTQRSAVRIDLMTNPLSLNNFYVNNE